VKVEKEYDECKFSYINKILIKKVQQVFKPPLDIMIYNITNKKECKESRLL
jgi:hypothetical protein